uniref:Uncharacterized protein n=1 Tax=Otus sunia TaxID=257818 RepID=A0A8C8ANN4_9STRI
KASVSAHLRGGGPPPPQSRGSEEGCPKSTHGHPRSNRSALGRDCYKQTLWYRNCPLGVASRMIHPEGTQRGKEEQLHTAPSRRSATPSLAAVLQSGFTKN